MSTIVGLIQNISVILQFTIWQSGELFILLSHMINFSKPDIYYGFLPQDLPCLHVSHADLSPTCLFMDTPERECKKYAHVSGS